jgi:hypothetical protein
MKEKSEKPDSKANIKSSREILEEHVCFILIQDFVSMQSIETDIPIIITEPESKKETDSNDESGYIVRSTYSRSQR